MIFHYVTTGVGSSWHPSLLASHTVLFQVRKAAQHGVCSILRGSEFLFGDGAPSHHPAASSTAKFCVQEIEKAGGTWGKKYMSGDIVAIWQGCPAQRPDAACGKPLCGSLPASGPPSASGPLNRIQSDMCFVCIQKVY